MVYKKNKYDKRVLWSMPTNINLKHSISNYITINYELYTTVQNIYMDMPIKKSNTLR